MSSKFASDHDTITFTNFYRYHIETIPLICKANKWTGFYITASVMKELKSVFLENYNKKEETNYKFT